MAGVWPVSGAKEVAGADPQFGDLLKITINKYRLGWLLEMARDGPPSGYRNGPL